MRDEISVRLAALSSNGFIRLKSNAHHAGADIFDLRRDGQSHPLDGDPTNSKVISDVVSHDSGPVQVPDREAPVLEDTDRRRTQLVIFRDPEENHR